MYLSISLLACIFPSPLPVFVFIFVFVFGLPVLIYLSVWVYRVFDLHGWRRYELVCFGFFSSSPTLIWPDWVTGLDHHLPTAISWEKQILFHFDIYQEKRIMCQKETNTPWMNGFVYSNHFFLNQMFLLVPNRDMHRSWNYKWDIRWFVNKAALN